MPFNQGLYEPEYNSFDSYYLPWYDSSYTGDGPFREPLQYTWESNPNREGLYGELNLVYEEAGSGFLSGSLYSGYKQEDQVDYGMELLNSGGSNWVEEYKSYFASCWEEDPLPCGYGSSEKAETNDVAVQESSYPNLIDGVEEGSHGVNPWRPSYHFELLDGIEDSYSIPGEPNQPPENNNEDPWDYMAVWESIFGYWPCLYRLDKE